MTREEAKRWETLFMQYRKPSETCNVLVIEDHPFYCHAHSDAKNPEYKREEDEMNAAETIEWHRKQFPDVGYFSGKFKTWQEWMMFLLPHVSRHYGVNKDAVLKGWTGHYGVGIFYEYKLQMEKYAHLKPGEPCDHPGCLRHISHPCDGCGRIAGGVNG